MVYWTTDYFKILYKEYQNSGKTIRAFSKEHGFREERFYFWVRKIKEEAVSSIEQQPKQFIPIPTNVITSLSKRETQPTLIPEPKISGVKALKLTYPNGVIIQLENVEDIEMIKQLITLI